VRTCCDAHGSKDCSMLMWNGAKGGLGNASFWVARMTHSASDERDFVTPLITRRGTLIGCVNRTKAM